MAQTANQLQTETSKILPHNLASARTWSSGGSAYDRISRQIADAIEHATDRLDPRPGEKILDVGTGTGWTARRIAARGAVVTGVDIGEEVIATARDLSPNGVIDFQIADAEALPFPDGHFDAVASTFGVMFCARPEQAANELSRVCKPGGRLVLTTWSPTGSVREVFEMISGYRRSISTAAYPARSPFEWGNTSRLVEILGDTFDLAFEEGISYYRERDGAAAFETFARGFGPVVSLLDELDEEAGDNFRREFELFHERHRTGIGVLVPREYLVTAGRRHI